jgi:hypothetical protein
MELKLSGSVDHLITIKKSSYQLFIPITTPKDIKTALLTTVKWASIYYGTKDSTVSCLGGWLAVTFVSVGAHLQKHFDKIKVNANDTNCTNKLLKQQKTKNC